jgi:hypothetical protein
MKVYDAIVNMNPEEKRWFLMADGRVSGPFAKSEVDQRTSQNTATLIWGRGQTEWLVYDKWNRQLSDFEVTDKRSRQVAERQWKVRVDSEEMPPMTHDQMFDFLRTKSDLSGVEIWTEGYSEWKEIFQIHKIMDELGVSRRQHPRVPIMGTLSCEGATGSFEARILSISEGGLGITETPPVKIGEKFKGLLKSANLFAPIHATVEIVYVGGDGYAGLKFIGLHPESKSAIIEYVRKFQELRSQTATNINISDFQD